MGSRDYGFDGRPPAACGSWFPRAREQSWRDEHDDGVDMTHRSSIGTGDQGGCLCSAAILQLAPGSCFRRLGRFRRSRGTGPS
jgi:hypothetical protein